MRPASEAGARATSLQYGNIGVYFGASQPADKETGCLQGEAKRPKTRGDCNGDRHSSVYTWVDLDNVPLLHAEVPRGPQPTSTTAETVAVFDPAEFMRNLANSAKHLLPMQAPVLVKSDGTQMQLDSSDFYKRLGDFSGSFQSKVTIQYKGILDTSVLSKHSDEDEHSPSTPLTAEFSREQQAIEALDVPAEHCKHNSVRMGGVFGSLARGSEHSVSELSSADADAIAALQALGCAESELVSPISAAGVNSRHGAARGRAVTRACPCCTGRISIACKLCNLCGYTFRGGKEGGTPCTGPPYTNTPGLMLRPTLSPELALSADCGNHAYDDEECSRLTTTSVTQTLLELHKKKEQERRATEKRLLARLQTLLFVHREKAPTASEVTYNYVLECAVLELQTRASIRQGIDLPAGSSEAPLDEVDPPLVEKHKLKEKNRRAKKRHLLILLQYLVLG